MSEARQLELDLSAALAAAEQVPEDADLQALWSQFAAGFDQLPLREQLRLGGLVIAQLAGLCQTKAEIFWEDWQDAHNTEGPILDDAWLQKLVRQSHHVDVSELVKPITHIRQPGKPSAGDSVVAEVNKADLLALVEQLEAEPQTAALAVAHDENASAWIALITDWLSTHPHPLKLLDLQQQSQRPLIELWLGALLGGFVLEQKGEFYETQQVWISGPGRDVV
ncbi:MAG: hypothetical protein F6J97_21310 [Leptolyngbya sp. SIO4C1]|nr:hypothetical protein [Leptolyngbya sp. SIO4C1]